MGMDDIWDDLSTETQDWLIANNGDAVPADIAAEIDAALDANGADDIWATDAEPASGQASDGDDDPDAEDEDDEEFDARYLSEEAVDWIEEIANDE